MWSSSHTETINAPAETIWQRWTDVAHWPEQDDSLESGSIAGPFAAGSVITLKPKGSPTVRVTLTEVTQNQSFSSVGSLPLATLHFDHHIEPTAEGVQFTQSVGIDGPLAWLWSRLMGRTMANNLEARMKNLAQLVAK